MKITPTGQVVSSHLELGAMSTEELIERADRRRRRVAGRVVTYSPKVFIPLTELCRDRCGYCTFAKPPARLDAPFMELEEVLEIARRGAAVGCHEALFTLGEAPEDRYPIAADWLAERGHASTVDYLIEACRLVRDETGLLPHANAGALARGELARLRVVSPSQGMMIESLRDDLECHRSAPDKTAERRLATLEWAGELAVPFTTGILVGIGEDEPDRIEALAMIEAAHARHDHVQEVIVQNFLPKPGTSMAGAAPCSPEEHLRAIALARLILSDEVSVQAPPNLADDLESILGAGVDDWGGVSPVTLDHVNPERPWPDLELLAQRTESVGRVVVPRLTAHPRFVCESERWFDPENRFPVQDRSDASGFARESDAGWYSGAPTEPPLIVPTPAVGDLTVRPDLGPVRASGAVAEVIEGVRGGEEAGVEELETLFGARGADFRAVCELADGLRAETVGDEVTWVANRNINYTNVCTFKCRFCGFSKGPLSLNLRGTPYLLGLDEIAERVREAADLGATEVCLQGGIHPDFDGDYYVDVARAVHDAAPDMHIHGFTALEVTEGARRSGEPLDRYLRRCMDAGLRTLPGTAAEILDDEVRAVLCSDKINTEEWLEAHRVAHSVGLRSNVTIMFGSIERPLSWARHLVRTRDLQKETGGFTEFVPLPFVHMAAPMYLQRSARRGPTFREAVLMHAVGRIAYRGTIDNIQASWVKLGFEGARQVLCAGANDLGGTLINENISRAAGAEHGQAATEADFGRCAQSIGRRLVQRTTLYGRPEATGEPLARALA